MVSARKPKRPTKDPDAHTLALVRGNHNLLVPHFLIHSWLYYVADAPVIQDATFDVIVELLEAKWDTVEHRHKHLIDRSLLKSGFYLEYPGIVPGAARSFASMFTSGRAQ